MLTQADLTNEVVHFTLRLGPNNDQVDAVITQMDGPTRLERILQQRRLVAHQVFYDFYGDPVVCFTEATRSGLAQLVTEHRYLPWGIGFAKDFVFQRGGGPAFYVRGDQWAALQQELHSARILSFATRYWPGSDDPNAPDSLKTESEYAHEREWRLPCPAAAPTLQFSYDDVRLLVVPDLPGLDRMRAAVPQGALDHAEVIVLRAP